MLFDIFGVVLIIAFSFVVVMLGLLAFALARAIFRGEM